MFNQFTFSTPRLRRFAVWLVAAALGLLGVAPAFAQTAVPTVAPMTLAEITTETTTLINTFGLMPFVVASAVFGVAMWLYAKAKSSSR